MLNCSCFQYCIENRAVKLRDSPALATERVTTFSVHCMASDVSTPLDKRSKGLSRREAQSGKAGNSKTVKFKSDSLFFVITFPYLSANIPVLVICPLIFCSIPLLLLLVGRHRCCSILVCLFF